jgi:tetratricopeptide (TPR) repeat protein
MKKILFLSFISLTFIGCSNSAPNVSQQPIANANSSNERETQTVAAHTTEKSLPSPIQKSETKTKWTQSGNPIDTSAFNAEIEKAEKNLKSKPKDEAAKKILAEAYNKRGLALTEARQYASALGDYRKALKLEPDNAEAKKWIEQIVGIYESINRDYPKEGEEPPPLPFEKKT